jgi:CheY-like chemotaxis protein
VKVCEVIKEVELLIRHALPKNITLEIDQKCDWPCWVMADPTHLHQVLMNLALNARDAMLTGGILRIHVGQVSLSNKTESPQLLDRGDEFVQIKVVDTGTGMPSEILKYIFEPFFTTKARGEGTGLGLSIIHGIVEDHGGQIEVESVEGSGTTFIILLPLIESPEKAGRESDRLGTATKQGESIVLNGATPYLRGTIASLLEARGYEVLLTGDGDALLETLSRRRGKIQLVILDAEQGGFDHLREIREKYGTIPAIILAGKGGVGEAGLDRHTVAIKEPFGVGELADTVGDLLEKCEKE